MSKLDTLVNKITSARFIMSVVITLAGCLLTWYICKRFIVENKELVTFVIGQFFMIWANVTKDYFNRTDREQKPNGV